jgi:quercetin dioxygenase-like cupin family protein
MKTFELGYFGNIWVRQHVLEKAHESHSGHEHKFDHVTLLTSGKVQVEIEGKGSKEFTAPTFIVIRKEQKHTITSLEDGTVYYCVFALRDLDGEVMDIYSEEHDPESSGTVPDGYWANK